jgi:hypothetical protein
MLLSRLKAPAQAFNRSKVWAVAGLTVGFGLWCFGFMVIAGEYFAMWQSKDWNEQEAAFRIATEILGVQTGRPQNFVSMILLLVPGLPSCFRLKCRRSLFLRLG